MVFGLFSRSGNPNTMRRWWRFQRAMTKKRWLEMDRERNGPISLWNFKYPEDALDAAWVSETAQKGGWRISDDSVIDGYSKATLELVHTHEDYKRILRGEPSLSMEDPERIGASLSEGSEDEFEDTEDEDPAAKEFDFVPFIRWQGTIDTTVNRDGGESDKNVQRSGFCAIRTPEYPLDGANLSGRYNALEISCRSDGRPYSVNLKCESAIMDDMYQCFINIPPTIKPGTEPDLETGGKFDQVVLLFQHFIVTSGGRMRARQRELDNLVQIRSIGFTLMDGVDGDFQFDLASIRAVNYDESGVIGEES